MKLTKIRIAIGLMSLALVGLVAIQVYWITKAVAVNNESFERQVNGVLQDIALKLERKDAFAFISRHSWKDTAILPDVGIKTLSPEALKPFLLHDLQRAKQSDCLPDGNESLQSYDAGSHKGTRLAAIFNVDMPETDPATDNPDEVNKLLKKKYLLQKLAMDLCQRANPLDQRIDFRALDTMLHRELVRQNINIPFQYGIYQETDRRFLKTSSDSDLPQLRASVYQARLFPNDFFLGPNLLKLYFPGKNAFLMKRIGAIMASSLVFILIILLTFMWMIRNFLQQKKLSEMKTDFINNMTHEFKTPITTIALASEALKDNEVKKDDTRLNRLANVIGEENRRLESQVERVLQMARLDKGDFKLNLEMVDIHAVICKAVQHISLMLDERGGELDTQLQATRSEVFGDKVHLTNIVYNLLDNAIKYSPENPEISIRTLNVGEQIVVEVADSGIGMTSEQQKRVFEKFYRVPTGNIHNVKGFGLGLSYVKTISEAHGGHISVRSSLGRGSTFAVLLPLDCVHA